jgi:anthranilate phosphoribosyltransferase
MTALLATRDEAQIGAFLLALRMKGESAQELAGFCDALPAPRGGAHMLDVDAHADGHEGRPTLLPAAAILAQAAGLDVLLRVDRTPVRGQHNHVAAVADALGVPTSDLAVEHPQLKELLDVRARVGVRTFINSLVKLWSPRGAPARLVGIFHGPYHEPMAQALALIGAHGLVVQAQGGLPEPHPDKPCKMTPTGGATFTFDPRPLGGVRLDSADSLALNRAALDDAKSPARIAARIAAAAMLVAAGVTDDMAAACSRTT